MKTWLDMYIQKGTYISQAFDISSAYDYYMHNLISNYDLNDGTVDVFIRIAYDGENYGKWEQITDSALEEIFGDDFYGMESAKFQYKVEMVNNGDTSPVFKSFSFSLYGAYIFDNEGDVICKPELWIKKTNSSGNVTLTNETNKQVLQLMNLNKDEVVYIDCENEDIETSLPNKYRYSEHNNVYLQFEVGENVLTGEGDFELSLRYEFKLLQG